MKAGEIRFLSFINGKKYLVIPIYQCTYSWTYEQCQQLWDDIVQMADNLIRQSFEKHWEEDDA